MPINYLNLQPQIKGYCEQAKSIYKSRARKIDQALGLLHRCADEIASGALQNVSTLTSPHAKSRCARPNDERIDQSYRLIKKVNGHLESPSSLEHMFDYIENQPRRKVK